MKKLVLILIALLSFNIAQSQLKIDMYEMHHGKKYERSLSEGYISFSNDSIVAYVHCPELKLNIYDLENYNGYFIGYLKGSKKPVIIYRHHNMIFINWKNYSYRLHIKEK